MSVAVDPTVGAIGAAAPATDRAPGALVRRPALAPVTLAGAAWAGYVALRVGAAPAGHAGHAAEAALMAAAMMAPLALPVAAAAARTVAWRRAGAAVAVAVAVFAALWALAGVALHVAGETAVAVADGRVVVAYLGAWCALEAASRRRAERLAACDGWRPIFPGAALAGVADASARATARGVATCWAPMAVTAVDPRPATVAAVSVLVLAERLVVPRPRWGLAVAYGLVAAVATWTLP